MFLPPIGMWAGWDFKLVRQVAAVLILLLWMPLGVVVTCSGFYRFYHRPTDANFEYYFDVVHRVFMGSICTIITILLWNVLWFNP